MFDFLGSFDLERKRIVEELQKIENSIHSNKEKNLVLIALSAIKNQRPIPSKIPRELIEKIRPLEKIYTESMARIEQSRQKGFIDLFQRTLQEKINTWKESRDAVFEAFKSLASETLRNGDDEQTDFIIYELDKVISRLSATGIKLQSVVDLSKSLLPSQVTLEERLHLIQSLAEVCSCEKLAKFKMNPKSVLNLVNSLFSNEIDEIRRNELIDSLEKIFCKLSENGIDLDFVLDLSYSIYPNKQIIDDRVLLFESIEQAVQNLSGTDVRLQSVVDLSKSLLPNRSNPISRWSLINELIKSIRILSGTRIGIETIIDLVNSLDRRSLPIELPLITSLAETAKRLSDIGIESDLAIKLVSCFGYTEIDKKELFDSLEEVSEDLLDTQIELNSIVRLTNSCFPDEMSKIEFLTGGGIQSLAVIVKTLHESGIEIEPVIHLAKRVLPLNDVGPEIQYFIFSSFGGFVLENLEVLSEENSLDVLRDSFFSYVLSLGLGPEVTLKLASFFLSQQSSLKLKDSSRTIQCSIHMTLLFDDPTSSDYIWADIKRKKLDSPFPDKLEKASVSLSELPEAHINVSIDLSKLKVLQESLWVN